MAFESDADNLVISDTNDRRDIFVHDQQTGVTTLVSVASNGTQGNQGSYDPSISADGRFVAFWSYADNLVISGTNGYRHIFVHNRQTGQTTLVSVASNGTQGNDWSYDPSISADGRFVAFWSYASNLVISDTNGSTADIFVHDQQTGETTLVSMDSDGNQGNYYGSYRPSISANGNIVAFDSYYGLVISDTNSASDIFLHDRQTGKTTRVSVASDGTEGNSASENPSISADGSIVAFESYAANLVVGEYPWRPNIFVNDQRITETTRVSVAYNGTGTDGSSWSPPISTDGRFVAFESGARNLVISDTNNAVDIFVHDRQTGETARVSVASNGAEGNDDSYCPSISADGRFVAFYSVARNLVDGDNNGVADVFVASNPFLAASSVTKHYYANGQRIATRVDGTLYYVHSDMLGSTVALSDAAGGEVGRVQYDPYGEVLTSALPVTLTDQLFTGARFDGTIGLYQMGARWYDPALGRWIQPDTIVPKPTNPQDLNRYTYVRNNPLRYTDPSGHQGEEGWWLREFRPPESWSWWDVAVMVFTFDIFAQADWELRQPKGTTARRMQEQLEEVQAWQRRNIREPIYARFPVVRTIDEVVESPEFQMGLMAAMMTANAPPGRIVPVNEGEIQYCPDIADGQPQRAHVNKRQVGAGTLQSAK